MDITKAFIKAKQPCADGFRWYVRNASANDSYQQLLDTLVAEDRVSDACWLLEQFGPTDAVRTLDHLEASAVVFAGTLKVRSHIDVDTVIAVGRDLWAGGGIRAGTSITVGGDLSCDAALACEGECRVGGDVLVALNAQAGGTLCAGRVRVGWNLMGRAGLRARGNVWVGHSLHLADTFEGERGLRVGDDIECGAGMRAGNGVECGRDLQCAGHLDAGWGIRVGGDVKADGAIRAGESIRAGNEIHAGPGYGIYAGLVVRTDAWEVSAQVRASRYPQALKSGWWTDAALAPVNDRAAFDTALPDDT